MKVVFVGVVMRHVLDWPGTIRFVFAEKLFWCKQVCKKISKLFVAMLGLLPLCAVVVSHRLGFANKQVIYW